MQHLPLPKLVQTVLKIILVLKVHLHFCSKNHVIERVGNIFMFLVKFAGSSNSGFATQSRYCGGFLNSHDTATIDTKVRGVYSATNLNSPLQMKIMIIFISKIFLNQFSRLYGTFWSFRCNWCNSGWSSTDCSKHW